MHLTRESLFHIFCTQNTRNICRGKCDWDETKGLNGKNVIT